MSKENIDNKEKKTVIAAEAESEDHYFIPDLCAIQPVFFLVLISELMSIVLVLATGSVNHFDWERLALVSLFVQWVALTSAALLCQARPYLRKLPNHWAATIGYSLILTDTAVFSALSQWVTGSMALDSINAGEGFSSLLGKVLALDWMEIVRNVIIAAIIGGMVLRYFYLQEQLNAKLRSELTHRLQALQSRIRPHFLFNSMNIIASLIETDPETAESVVEDLSGLFRASLNEVGNQVPFAQEVSLCERYIRIEKLRLGQRLTVEWAVDQVSDKVKIPLLTLQPLLENAIYHGIQPLPEGGKITIKGTEERGYLTLRVENPLPSTAALQASTVVHKSAKYKGNRMALENIRHRLLALYGEQAMLKIEEQNNKYIVSVSYPLQ